MTAHELIEMAARAIEHSSPFNAACVRDLKLTIPDGVICEPEPDCWLDLDSGALLKSYWTAPSNELVPLYRAAKEPTK